jgi:hypothetical protein
VLKPLGNLRLEINAGSSPTRLGRCCQRVYDYTLLDKNATESTIKDPAVGAIGSAIWAHEVVERRLTFVLCGQGQFSGRLVNIRIKVSNVSIIHNSLHGHGVSVGKSCIDGVPNNKCEQCATDAGKYQAARGSRPQTAYEQPGECYTAQASQRGERQRAHCQGNSLQSIGFRQGKQALVTASHLAMSRSTATCQANRLKKSRNQSMPAATMLH